MSTFAPNAKHTCTALALHAGCLGIDFWVRQKKFSGRFYRVHLVSWGQWVLTCSNYQWRYYQSNKYIIKFGYEVCLCTYCRLMIMLWYTLKLCIEKKKHKYLFPHLHFYITNWFYVNYFWWFKKVYNIPGLSPLFLHFIVSPSNEVLGSLGTIG